MCRMIRRRASPGTKLNAEGDRSGGHGRHNNLSTFFFLSPTERSRGLPTLDTSQIYSRIHLFVHFNKFSFSFNFYFSVTVDSQSYFILASGVQHSG